MPDETYIKEFVSESSEHINNLNNSLVKLEKSPDSKELINSLFRSFHTIKGNSAAMGFTNMSELAHQLENVLGKIRDGKLAAKKDIISVLLQGVDGIERCMDKVQADGSDAMDFSDVISKVKQILSNESAAATATTASASAATSQPQGPQIIDSIELTQHELEIIEDLKKDSKRIFRITAVFGDMPLKEVKAMILLRNISDVSFFITSSPKREKLSEIKNVLEVITAAQDPSVFKDAGISGIEKITIADFIIDGKNQRTVEVKKASSAQTSATPFSGSPTTAATPASAVAPATPLSQEDSAKRDKINATNMDITKETQSVRIGIDRLDKLMEMVGELVIHRMRLSNIAEKYNSKELSEVLGNLDRLVLNIQEEVIEERMIPIGQIYNKFPRMVRDLSSMEGKKVNFLTDGSDIKFDRTVLDEIGDPMIHILRNSIDHGIETPEERIKAGKPEEGTIKISARREKSFAVIEVEDDGAGIDVDVVKEVAFKKGLITEQEKKTMGKEDAQMLIFNPGMSTSKVVTAISGRGVGMNVVKEKVTSLSGRLKLVSDKGKGTKLSMHLPLSLAIIQALLIRVGKEIYALPISSVSIIEEISKRKIKTIQNEEVFILFDSEVPLIWLHDVFGFNRHKDSKMIVIVVEKGEKKIGLVVDEILCEQQILIKSLNNLVKHTKGFAGATILGNGEVCLIIDIMSLV